MSAATGSDSITLVSIATPEPAWRAAASATILSPRSARAAVRIVSDAPVSPATSTARSTARVAVADPSVPTRIRWYMAPRYPQLAGAPAETGDRKRAGEGTRGAVRVEIGGRGISTKKKKARNRQRT